MHAKGKAKRARSLNFNKNEEDILLRCVLRQIKIIENKKTDALAVNAK